MNAPRERWMSNRGLRRRLAGIVEIMGSSGMNLVLRQSGLERFAESLPPEDDRPAILRTEYAALYKAIEDYLGSGARSSLMRIGRAAYRKSQPPDKAQRGVLGRVLAGRRAERTRLDALRLAGEWLAGKDELARVASEGNRAVLVTTATEATSGRKTETPSCWLTLGAIREALRLGTGHEHEVVEAECQASGAPACRFDVGPPLE